MKEWTHDQAAEAMGLSRGGFIKLERGERMLDEKSIQTAANVFEVPKEVVLGEQTPIRVMGYIGAGASIDPDFEQVPPHGLEQIDLPFSVPDGIVAFRVKGNSMLPAYRDGDAVLVWEEQRHDTEEYVGQEAAVRTDTGFRALKEIQAGVKRGFFNLASHNDSLIKAVRIVWVGELYLVVKARQVKTIKRAR